MILDATLGLALAAALLVMLTVAVGQQRRGARHFAEQRALVRAAEAALIDLQRHQPPTADDDAIRVEVQPLDAAGAPLARRWVQVRASRGEQSAALVGLVPDAALNPSGVMP